jgi:GDP-4-dehydro-6-deoxy-D-mannose reductase
MPLPRDTSSNGAGPFAEINDSDAILVTGASGFFGQYIVEQLKEVTGSLLLMGRTANQKMHFCADISQKGAWQEELSKTNISRIIHLAGQPRLDNQLEALKVHISGLNNLLDAVQNSSPWIMLISSGAVYGNVLPSYFPIKETQLCAPTTEYGHLKLEQEDLIKARKDEFDGICIVRPSNLIGPQLGPQFFLGHLIRTIYRSVCSPTANTVLEMGDLGLTRDFLDVRDAALAVSALANKKRTGIFNLGAQKEFLLRDIVDLCIKRFGATITITENAGIFHHPITRQSLSYSALEGAINWTPTIPLQQTTDDMFRCLTSQPIFVSSDTKST